MRRPTEGLTMLDLSLRPTTPRTTSARVDHLWIVIAIGSIMAGLPAVLAGMIASRQTPVYAARADVQFRIDGPVSSDNLRTDRRLSTQLVSITSRALLEPIAKERGLTYDVLRKATSTSIVDNSEVIRIEVRNTDRAKALSTVQAVVDAYLKRARGEFEVRRASLEKQVNVLVGEQQVVTDRVLALGRAAETAAAVAPPGTTPVVSPELVLLQERDRSLEAQRLALRTQLNDLEYRIQTGGPAVMIGDPYGVNEQISPKPVLAEIAGGLVGLTLAATTVSLYIWWRRRVA
jgi:hypothetical protein